MSEAKFTQRADAENHNEILVKRDLQNQGDPRSGSADKKELHEIFRANYRKIIVRFALEIKCKMVLFCWRLLRLNNF